MSASSPSKKTRVYTLDRFTQDGAKLVRLGEREVALFRRNGKFYALDNRCPHQGGPLGEGHFDGDSVVCPWHHWDFHLETGKSRLGPDVCVRAYAVVVEGNDIFLLHG